MFTVLISEKEHIDAIRQENKLFFEPFLESKEIAFCYWNPQGQSIADSVPGLTDAVGRRKKWRAVIINNYSHEGDKKRNPFDVVDFSAVNSLTPPLQRPETDESIEEWENTWKEYYSTVSAEKEKIYKNALECPLQKLSTWLCFRPEDYVLNEVTTKQDIQEWAMEMIGRDTLKCSVKLELLERNQYKQELQMKEKLRRAFLAEEYLNIAYPSEVHCISLRSSENNYFDPDAYWNIRQDCDYSDFCNRNMYFDKMRFMVFDILPSAHRDFRTDYIRFLASVLIFISNPTPGSAMQARRLYSLNVKTDDTPLCTLVTSYDKKLSATFEVIENEIEKIKSEIPGELTDKAAEALFCTPKDIPVLLDASCDPEKVFVEKDYGLSFDCPQDEFHKWNCDYSTSQKSLVYIAKQQSRSVRKSVVQMHLSSEVSDVNASRLTPLQRDDIRYYTDNSEDEMIDSIPPDITDTSVYTERMAEESQKVKKVIRRRMTKKTTIALSAICTGLYLLCCLPFIFTNGTSAQMISTAFFLSMGMLGLLAVIMFVSLFFLRNSVLKAVKNYNNTMREITGDIHASMKRFSKFLSNFCNVRRGNSVLNYTQKNIDEYTKSLRIRKRHQEDIRKKRAQLAENYADYFGDRTCCDETMSRPYDYDFDQMTEYDYPAPFLAGDCRQIEFISNGNFVTVPSSYVKCITVSMEGIYE